MSLLEEELRRILSKESVKDLEQPLRQLIARLVEEFKPLKIIIAGSLARGEFVRGLSDIDILITVDHPISKDRRLILTHVNNVDAEVTVVSRGELEKAVREGNKFYINALTCGATVYRSTNT